MKSMWLLVIGLVSICFCDPILAGVREKTGLGFDLSFSKVYGNKNIGDYEFGGRPLNFRFNVKPNIFIDTDIGYSRVSAPLNSGKRITPILSLGFRLGYRFFPEEKWNPLLYIGSGGLAFRTLGGRAAFDAYAAFGAGTEIFVSEQLGLNLMVDYRYTSGDNFDGMVAPKGSDSFLNLFVGLNYYFDTKNAWAYNGLKPVEVETVDDTDSQAMRMKIEAGNPENIFLVKREALQYAVVTQKEEMGLFQAKASTLSNRIDEIEDLLRTLAFVEDGDDTQAPKTEEPQMSDYHKALLLFRAGSYDEAVKSFGEMIIENPRHLLAGNWWYWMGESYNNMKIYDKAITAFQKSATLTASQLKAEIIQMMIGLCQVQSGEHSQAQLTFEQLLLQNENGLFSGLAHEYLLKLDWN